MNLFSKRIVLKADYPLFKKAHPVLLTIFCRGVLATDAKQLTLGAMLSILASPVGWVVLIAKKLIHLAIILAVWWLLRAEIAVFGVSEYVVLALALLALFYMDLYRELLDFFLYFLVIITGGYFLRWMCAGYLSGKGFQHTSNGENILQ